MIGRRRHPRRQPPAVHRPGRPAPVTPDEVLERAPAPPRPPDLEWVTCADFLTACTHDGPHVPVGLDGRPADVSRETFLDEPPQPMAPFVAGGLPMGYEAAMAAYDDAREEVGLDRLGPPPPLREEQVAGLEALGVQAEERAAMNMAALLGQDPLRALADVHAAPPLRKEQIARLEALTAVWARETRLGGPQPDDTLLYAAPKPPPPPPSARPEPAADPVPVVDPVEAPGGPAARASDWTSRHDPRSLEYRLRARLRTSVPVHDVLLPHGPILDQGTTPPLSLRDASACVGMAVVAAANALALRGRDPALSFGGLDAHDAMRLYTAAQDLDHVSGRDYPGTSVLAGMKAAQDEGIWEGYLWAIGGTKDVAQALLQLRLPVVLGLPWFPDMETPDAAGIVRPTGGAPAGHALTAVGLQVTVAGKPGPYFVLQQSRGEAEGVGGLIYLHHAHLAQLLQGSGEAAVPIPRGGLG